LYPKWRPWLAAFLPFLLVVRSEMKELVARRPYNREAMMIITRQLLAGCAAAILIVGAAQAGPCNTAAGQTTGTGTSAANEHPPTSSMNRDVATSSRESEQQMQGRSTAAQQANDPEPSAKMTDQDQPTASQQTQSAEPSEKMNDQGC
jgi:hypothetical protein